MKMNYSKVSVSLVTAWVLLSTPAVVSANACSTNTNKVKAEIGSIYDKKLQKYKTLKDNGAVTVRVDLDDDGPNPPEIFKVEDVIAAYEKAKSDGLVLADSGHEECESAYKDAKKEATINLAVDPAGTVLTGLLESPLEKIGLGENNDFRGALITGLIPAKPIVKLITKPSKVIKPIIHKPYIIFTPWKW